MRRVFFRLSVVLFAMLFSKGARATPDFPLILRSRFNIATDPALMCTLCHRSAIGGAGMVTKPFGITLMKHGLMAFDSAGFSRILTEMETNGDDSDGDGVGDIAELKAGTDPNVNDVTGEAGEQPRYGCFCNTPRGGAHRSTTGGPWLTALLFCAWRVRSSSAQRGAKRLRRLSPETAARTRSAS
jgi:hypothetical protein